ncbi:paraquat-inducible protein A [Thalassospira sp. HF15]|uniref:paraquat-inducible protein A n=1 Tax=Thalassospira sp. HF15 TaxID=2722755 RepID=UPI001430D70E|nr:paraquat-inducible protein A [Thalassospira sp. HF15]NIY74496.1 paraquat-inducible protein A [Thalassospira sp. HF15]
MSHRLIACEHCDYLHVEEDIPAGSVAYCRRCGSPLYSAAQARFDKPLALAVTAFLLFLIANSYPLLTFAMEGRVETNTLGSGVLTFWREGFPFLAIMVAVTSMIAPLFLILAHIYVLLPITFNRRMPGMQQLWRILAMIRPWSMLDVFLIGLLVALTKLTDYAEVIAGPAFFAICCLIPTVLLMNITLDPRYVWRRLAPTGLSYPEATDIKTQNSADQSTRTLLTCHTCAMVVDSRDKEHARCPRCGDMVHHRKPRSLSRAWALLVAAVILYIPANVFPIMTVTYLGRTEADTILSGVSELVGAGEWPIAIVVFTASILVPIIKIILLGWVYLATAIGLAGPLKERTLIYRITELVGRWSMVDVFMVSILAALVKLGNIASVQPGFGAVAFCGVVILTMLSAMAFDPRLMWDRAGMKNAKQAGPDGNDQGRGDKQGVPS